ncbi:MAG: hypothetical protein WC708_08060 [Lentisphaeria bacterium]
MNAQWTFKQLAEQQVLLITVTGAFALADSERLVNDIRNTRADLEKVHILTDFRGADLKLETVDIFECPKAYQQLAKGRHTRVAMLFKIIRDETLFYENVCRNLGYDVSVFTDYDQAMQWLTAGTASQSPAGAKRT